MVAGIVLLSDVVQNVVFLATPPLLWLFLYLVAWERPELARRSGFTRRAFWLLLPGALLGSLADLPLAVVHGNVLAINLGGGVVPLFLAAVLLRERWADRPAALPRFAGLFVVESAAALVWILLAPATVLARFGPPWGVALDLPTAGVLLLAAVVPLAAAVAGRRDPATARAAYGAGLASFALAATFLTTQAIPGYGIVSSFPAYLLAPAAVGAVAVLGARSAGGLAPAEGLVAGYAGATAGVLVGADVLRQPPLYATTTDAIYAIGGAGLLDLLYLSGLLALVAGVAVLALRGEVRPTAGPAPAPRLTPTGELRRALALLLAGRPDASVAASAAAARDARATVRALTGLPAEPAAGVGGWGEAGAFAWVDGDQANLEALAAAPGLTPRDAWRAHLTARHLVRLGREIAHRHFGTTIRRGLAFLVDLAVVAIPGVAVWALLAALLPGSLDAVLAGAAFNAAALGYAAVGFVAIVVAETAWGTTPGKRLFRLRVRDRGLGPAAALPVVVRDLPKLVPFTIVGFGGAVATLLLVRGAAGAGGFAGIPGVLTTTLSLAVLVAIGLAICGAVSALAMSATSESQRLGDYLAGTWVIQE